MLTARHFVDLLDYEVLFLRLAANGVSVVGKICPFKIIISVFGAQSKAYLKSHVLLERVIQVIVANGVLVA